MLNLQKTKIMTTGTLNEFILDETEVDIINCYTFLGTVITRDGYEHKENNRRLSIGRMAITKLEKIMKDQDVMKATKIKITETIIFPTVTYGSESWTVRKKERKKLIPLSYGRGEEFYEFCGQRGEQTFQFWRNETQKIIRSNNPPFKAMFFGHVMRAKGSLEWDIMLGQVAGYRRQGKPRMHWLDSIKEATSPCLEALKEIVQDRKKLVHSGGRKDSE
jgi:hypothetical protein